MWLEKVWETFSKFCLCVLEKSVSSKQLAPLLTIQLISSWRCSRHTLRLGERTIFIKNIAKLACRTVHLFTTTLVLYVFIVVIFMRICSLKIGLNNNRCWARNFWANNWFNVSFIPVIQTFLWGSLSLFPGGSVPANPLVSWTKTASNSKEEMNKTNWSFILPSISFTD